MLMLWALMFLAVALVTAIVGFSGAAGAASWIAKALFLLGTSAFLFMYFVARGSRRPRGPRGQPT